VGGRDPAPPLIASLRRVNEKTRYDAFARDSGEILVDEVRWIVGDVRGAPCTASETTAARLSVSHWGDGGRR